jgi:hypothetical protein
MPLAESDTPDSTRVFCQRESLRRIPLPMSTKGKRVESWPFSKAARKSKEKRHVRENQNQ